MSQEVLLQDRDARGVVTLTLNRPEKYNALSLELMHALCEALDAMAGDETVRMVVLTGAGKAFCSGGDLGWMRDTMAATREKRMEDSNTLSRMLEKLNTLPKPVIARVNGLAFGGGVGLMSCCDVVVASEAARFGLSEVSIGLTPATISPFVIRCIGEARARDWMLTARRFGVEEARLAGLVSHAAPPENLDAAVEEVIRDILRCAPGALARTKQLIFDVAAMPLEHAVTHTPHVLAQTWEGEEAPQGIAAFFEKRDPPWRRRE